MFSKISCSEKQATRRFWQVVVLHLQSNSLKSICRQVTALKLNKILFKDFEHNCKRAVLHYSFCKTTSFLCKLFFVITDIDFASYTDDNIPYTFVNDIKEVFWKLKRASEKLFPYFHDDQMKANPNKCNLLCDTNKKQQMPEITSR